MERQAALAQAAEGGELPLAYMLAVMRDETADTQRRDEMARAAAPYVHPRLSSIDGNLNVNLRHEQALDELE